MPKKAAIAYIPVLHKGYLDFLEQLQKEGVSELWLIGDEILELHEELDYINRKDRLRAVPVAVMQRTLGTITALSVFELTVKNAASIDAGTIITPQEDIGRVVVSHYFPDKEVREIPIFLRWNKDNIEKDIEINAATLPMNDFQKKLTSLMCEDAEKSFDWWRQVGAALVQNGEVIYVTHNEHMPEAQQPNIDGDTRSLFKKGIHIEYVTAAHAEVAAIATAAKQGIKTEGAELYVTDFPCPYCARLIAKAGIQKVYFMKGYAVLDGDLFLKEEGIELIHLEN